MSSIINFIVGNVAALFNNFNAEQKASIVRTILKLIGGYFVAKGIDANAIDQIMAGLTTIIVMLNQSNSAHSDTKA